MSRGQQDQFIDEDEEEEVCPLCVEELDITDKNFRPCPCGYQICQFCYNNIKTTMNGLCPACRRPYKEENIQWKAVTQEEMLQHKQTQAQQAKKKAAAKQKEAQKREADNLSRKHLAGLRVRQKNLVYVTGFKLKTHGDKLIEVLRGPQYFGQYGEIVKIVVANPSKPQQSSVGLYVTFARNEDAATCIETMNGHYSDGSVRAQFGTTKYCSAYLRGETCNNRSCMFLHEPGDENERYTRQDLSMLNASSTQQPASTHPPPVQQSLPVAAATQDYGESAISPTESAALPATASWADSARRASRATTNSAASPLSAHPLPSAQQIPDLKVSTRKQENRSEQPDTTSTASSGEVSRSGRKSSKSTLQKTSTPHLDRVLRTAFRDDVVFEFDASHLSEKEQEIIKHFPPLWDPEGAPRRRAMKEREAEELRRQQEAVRSSLEAAAVSAIDIDETTEGGSLQLGGEPEERADQGFAHGAQSAIQPPQQGLGNAAFGFGPSLPLSDDLSSVGNLKRALTPQHQQQLLLQSLRGVSALSQPSGQQFGVAGANHGRQNSRFNFSETGTTTKAGPNSNIPKQTPSLLGQHQPLSSQYFSNVQGPPPGLRATGTPPISGGGMFGQGHGFTQSIAYSATGGRESDKIWDFNRAGQRSNVGNQSSEAGKRELPCLGQSNLDASQTVNLHSDATADASRISTSSLPPGLPLPPGFGRQLNNHQTESVGSESSERQPAPQDKDIQQSPERQQPTVVHQQVHDQDAAQGLLTNAAPPGRAASKLDRGSGKASNVKKKEVVIPPIQSPNVTPSVVTSPLRGLIMAAGSYPEQTGSSKTSSLAGRAAEREIDGMKPTKSMGPIVDKVISPVKESAGGPKRPHPGKLDIPKLPLDEEELVAAASQAVWAKGDSMTTALRAPMSTSRPTTPAAVVMNSPIRRTTQPRTLRITSTPVVETPPAISTPLAADNKVAAMAAPSKLPSRRPSLTSTISERVDATSFGSTNVSRPSSPPTIVANRKAERKKQKKQQQPIEMVVVEPTKPVEEVGPIMARKKKTKKPGAGPISKPLAKPTAQKQELAEELVDKDTVASSSKQLESSPKPQELTTPKEAIPVSPTPKSKKMTTNSPPSSSDKPLTAAAILGALESTQQLALSTLALLKPLTNAKNASWLMEHASSQINNTDLQNHLQQLSFEISKAERDLVKQGHAIRKDMANARVSGRNLITPNGERYACLSREEEDQVLRLERRIAETKGVAKWGGGKAKGTVIPKTALRVEGDPTEITSSTAGSGDIRHNAGHIDLEDDVLRYINAFIPPTASPEGSLVRNNSPRPSTSAEISNAFDTSARETLAAVAAAALNATAHIEDHLGMQARDLAAQAAVAAGLSLKEAEKLLVEKKREAEAWEKKVNAHVKKNRKAVFGGRGDH